MTDKKQQLYPHTERSYLICNAGAARESVSPAMTIMRPSVTVSAALGHLNSSGNTI